MKELTILFGGSSFEHEISIVSAVSVGKLLDCDSYLFLDAKREFYLIEKEQMKSSYFSSGEYKKAKKVYFRQGGAFIKTLFGTKAIPLQTVLNLIHGRDGEDGKIASLLQLHGIDFIGPRIEASVLSYNKLLTKQYARQTGVKTLPYEVVDMQNRAVDMEFPLIVKPLRLGSSIGISVVHDKEQLDFALDVAFEYDEQALVEPFIEGIKEYNVAGALTPEGIALSTVEEPKKQQILDFEKKYMDFSRDDKVQEAQIAEGLKQELYDAFTKVYGSLFAGSLIRCDFFVHGDEVYLNEINPIPGSMANYLFDDFAGVVAGVGASLPKEHGITVDYKYINNIQAAKGKAR